MDKELINLGAECDARDETSVQLSELKDAELALIGGGFGDVTLS